MAERHVPPVVLLLGAIVGGILAAPFLPLPAAFVLTAGAGFFCAGVAFAGHSQASARVCFALVFALLALARARDVFLPGPHDISQVNGGPSVWVRGVVAGEVEADGRGVAGGFLRVRRVHDFVSTRAATGRVRFALYPASYGAAEARLPYAGEAVWLRGRLEEPRAAANPGAFDYRAYLARRGVFSQMTVRHAGDVRAARAEPNLVPVSLAASRIRRTAREATRAHLRPDDAALLDGLLLSARGRLPADVEEDFAATGTVHILSVSGLHVMALAWGLRTLLRRLAAPRPAANLVSAAVLWVFVLASGAGDAAVRAGLMASALLAAPLLRRSADPFHSLCAAACAILLSAPGALHEAGFQLSFVTTGALVLAMPPLVRLLLPPEGDAVGRAARWCAAWVLLPLLVSLVAQAGSAPLVAYHFNRVSLVGPLANVPVAALSLFLLLAGAGAVLVSVAAPALSGTLLTPVWGLLAGGLGLLRFLARAFANVPLASFSIISPPAWVILLYYGMLLWAIVVLRRRLARRSRPFAPPPSAPAPTDVAALGGGGGGLLPNGDTGRPDAAPAAAAPPHLP